jgi:hypothetical protein
MFNRYLYTFVEQGSEEWLKLHDPINKIITASIVPDIVGFGYQSKNRIYRQFKGLEKREFNEQTQQILSYGRVNEHNAAEQFKEILNLPQAKMGFIFHPYYDWLGCSPDRILRASDGEYELLEIKCPFKTKIPESITEIPLKYIIQCQIQLACLPSVRGCYLYIWRHLHNKNLFYLEPDLELQD